MARRGLRTPAGEGGFTLLEIMVVLAVIALGTALVMPRFTVRAKPPKPDLVMFLERQRARAVEAGRTVQVFASASAASGELLGADKDYVAPKDSRYDLPKGQSLDIHRPVPSSYADRRLVAAFYPDGTSMVGDFDLVLSVAAPGADAPRLHVVVTPMQGSITYAQR